MKTKMPISLLISIILHLLIIFYTPPGETIDNSQLKSFDVKLVNEAIKTIGIKDTKTKYFSLPTLKSKIKLKKQINKFLDNKRQLRKGLKEQLQTTISPETKYNPDLNEVLQKAFFNIKFDPPKGVNEDELNTVERIFYSFQKRAYLAYLRSFISNYQQQLRSNPFLKKNIIKKHRLLGKIIFDKKGNIISIEIIKSSEFDSIHNLFENTLKDIRMLPNPPVALIKDNQFIMYYYLILN